MLITLIFIFVHTESYLFKIIYVLFSLEIRRRITTPLHRRTVQRIVCFAKFQKSLFLCGRRLKRLVLFFTQICSYAGVPEQKARLSYDNLLRLIDDPDVRDPLKFLREREIVHFQRFGEALENVQENLDAKNYYAYNPAFDTRCTKFKKNSRG